MTLHAVVIAIPDGRSLPRSSRVDAGRRVAREALDVSAQAGGLPICGWRQNDKGVPLLENDIYWSISHKAVWAAGLAADRRVGIDIESLKPRAAEHFDQVATESEWALAGQRDWDTFYRMWTAKEATLKANGVGIGRMDHCKLVKWRGDHGALFEYDGSVWRVEYLRYADHLTAVSAVEGEVQWHIIGEAGPQ